MAPIKLIAAARASIWLFLAGMPLSLQAHRLDDLLQAALVEITPSEARIRLHLNPGIEVAPSLVWMIDRNGDQVISSDELDAYAKVLAGQIFLALDDRPLALESIGAENDSSSDLKSGDGYLTIRLRARFPRPPLDGIHALRFENRHLPEISVYLFNALHPQTPAVRIIRQWRDDRQNIGRIEFSISLQRADALAKSPLFVRASILTICSISMMIVLVRTISSVAHPRGGFHFARRRLRAMPQSSGRASNTSAMYTNQ